MHMDNFTSIVEVRSITLDKFTTFDAYECLYSGYAHYLMVNWVKPLFMKSKAVSIKDDNKNWWQAINGPFVGEYWKAACGYI